MPLAAPVIKDEVGDAGLVEEYRQLKAFWGVTPYLETLLGERLTWPLVLGGGLIILGVAIAQFGDRLSLGGKIAALAAVLFAIGAVGALTRRNGISIFLSIEVMLNAANLTLIAYARQWESHAGQVVVFFVMAVAAAEAAVGLALFIAVFRQRHTIDLNRINLLRW